MRTVVLSLMLMAWLLGGGTLRAEGPTVHVSPAGNDRNPGTLQMPLKSIGKAITLLPDGGTCLLHKGRYTDLALIAGYPGDAPLKIVAAPGERVVFDGRDPVPGPWTPHEGGIYKAAVTGAVEQVFMGDRMLVEARWPNMSFPEELWDRSKWASAQDGSGPGKMVDSALAETGIDWTGALAVLNLSHQWWTWTSPVTKHRRGHGGFKYDISEFGPFKPAGWWPYDDDRYYLCGKLEALDAPGEWFHDAAAGTLYLYPPSDADLSASLVLVKRRDYGIEVRNSRNVQLAGIHFVGSAFRFEKVDHCMVEDCHLLYGAYSREAHERYIHPFRKGKTPSALVVGDHNTIRRCSVGFSSGSGLIVRGTHNLIEENLVHDTCWNGSLDYTGLRVSGMTDGLSHNVIRRNTVMNGGNALIHTSSRGTVVELNHVYNGGRACNDVSLIYTQLPTCAGTEIRYNWVHGCFAPHIGLGIRGDNKTRGLRVHHNVVWDCSWEGIAVKGDHNLVYNNTGFHNGNGLLMMKNGSERERPSDQQWPGLKQSNQNSKIFNNVGGRMRGHRTEEVAPGAPGALFVNNLVTEPADALLGNVEQRDFRPRPASGLIDGGRIEEGLTDGFRGTAPDLGAYEHGGPYWVPGITWNPMEVLGYEPQGWEETTARKPPQQAL